MALRAVPGQNDGDTLEDKMSQLRREVLAERLDDSQIGKDPEGPN